MQKKFGCNDPKIGDYVINLYGTEDEVLKEVRERSAREGIMQIQVGSADARHLEVITRAVGAKKSVEIGTLAGYSGISILRGMEKGGRLYTFELDPKTADVARESFKKAGFASNVEIIVGRAATGLSSIEDKGPFDLVFIDADKTGYIDYLKWSEKNLRVGGVVLADNTFGWGKITQSNLSDDPEEKDVKGLQEFNAVLSKNPRFRSTILPTGEGLTMAVKIK